MSFIENAPFVQNENDAMGNMRNNKRFYKKGSSESTPLRRASTIQHKSAKYTVIVMLE